MNMCYFQRICLTCTINANIKILTYLLT